MSQKQMFLETKGELGGEEPRQEAGEDTPDLSAPLLPTTPGHSPLVTFQSCFFLVTWVRCHLLQGLPISLTPHHSVTAFGECIFYVTFCANFILLTNVLISESTQTSIGPTR